MTLTAPKRPQPPQCIRALQCSRRAWPVAFTLSSGVIAPATAMRVLPANFHRAKVLQPAGNAQLASMLLDPRLTIAAHVCPDAFRPRLAEGHVIAARRGGSSHALRSRSAPQCSTLTRSLGTRAVCPAWTRLPGTQSASTTSRSLAWVVLPLRSSMGCRALTPRFIATATTRCAAHQTQAPATI